MPKAANTKIGVPNPLKITARLDQRDVRIVLIMSPKMNMLINTNLSYTNCSYFVIKYSA